MLEFKLLEIRNTVSPTLTASRPVRQGVCGMQAQHALLTVSWRPAFPRGSVILRLSANCQASFSSELEVRTEG